MNILFICNQNKNRSKTAQEIFKGKFNTKSAGVYHKKAEKVPYLALKDEVCSGTFLNSAFLGSKQSATSSALKPKYCAFVSDNNKPVTEKQLS